MGSYCREWRKNKGRDRDRTDDWRLSEATPAQRNNYEIIGDGQGVHWPEIDEDLSVDGTEFPHVDRTISRNRQGCLER